MPAIETVLDRQGDLVKKALRGGVLIGSYPDAAEITTLHDETDGTILVPTGYESVGYIHQDGITFAYDQEVSDIAAWGTTNFIRRDVTSETKTVAFTALETRRLTKELVTGIDLSAVTMSANGEVTYDYPDTTPTKNWRVLTIATDGSGDSRFYFGRWYPKASVTERPEETWANGDEAMGYGVTMTAYLDEEIGTPCREFLFGPGALAQAEAMGWTMAPTG